MLVTTKGNNGRFLCWTWQGREPSRLFNLVEFMICDKDGGGTMSEDECMEILYHRFGKEVSLH